MELQRFELAKSGRICVQQPSELVLRIPPKRANQGLLRTQQGRYSAPGGTLQEGLPAGDIRSLKVEKSWMVVCPAWKMTRVESRRFPIIRSERLRFAGEQVQACCCVLVSGMMASGLKRNRRKVGCKRCVGMPGLTQWVVSRGSLGLELWCRIGQTGC
jgi:hypothetical protein